MATVGVVLRNGPLDGRRAVLPGYDPPMYLITHGLEVSRPQDGTDKPSRWTYFVAWDPVGFLSETETFDFIYEYYER